MRGYIRFVGLDRPVQTLIKQEIRAFSYLFPRRKRAGLEPMRSGVDFIVEVFSNPAAAGISVHAKERLELLEEVGFGTKMAEVSVAVELRLFE